MPEVKGDGTGGEMLQVKPLATKPDDLTLIPGTLDERREPVSQAALWPACVCAHTQ